MFATVKLALLDIFGDIQARFKCFVESLLESQGCYCTKETQLISYLLKIYEETHQWKPFLVMANSEVVKKCPPRLQCAIYLFSADKIKHAFREASSEKHLLGVEEELYMRVLASKEAGPRHTIAALEGLIYIYDKTALADRASFLFYNARRERLLGQPGDGLTAVAQSQPGTSSQAPSGTSEPVIEPPVDIEPPDPLEASISSKPESKSTLKAWVVQRIDSIQKEFESTGQAPQRKTAMAQLIETIQQFPEEVSMEDMKSAVSNTIQAIDIDHQGGIFKRMGSYLYRTQSRTCLALQKLLENMEEFTSKTAPAPG